ncbi:MAG: hypothetical protein MUQ56_06060, partial [Thermoleophilia bacterium]|nr:hypothetical protein [Thermoleophilia bacterium]
MFKAFGDNLFQVISLHPEKLATIPGITSARAFDIQTKYKEIEEDRQFDLFFATHGISVNLQAKLEDEYGDKREVISQLKTNPYKAADAVWGIGFKRADQISMSIGIKPDSPFRISAALQYVLKASSEGEGHCYLPHHILVIRAEKLLGVDRSAIYVAMNDDIEAGDLTQIDKAVYPNDLLWAEESVAGRLRTYTTTPHAPILHNLTEEDLAELDPDQQEALLLSLSS